MSGYSRKLVSLEITLKEIIKDLKAEALKEITGKSESHFRKCSDENDTQDIHHIDSIKIDIPFEELEMAKFLTILVPQPAV